MKLEVSKRVFSGSISLVKHERILISLVLKEADSFRKSSQTSLQEMYSTMMKFVKESYCFLIELERVLNKFGRD